MTALEVLIRIDAVAGLLLLALSIWLWGTFVRTLMERVRPASRSFLSGLACLTSGAAGVVLLNQVRRRIEAGGQNNWWVLDSWGYTPFKVLLILGAVLIIRSFTKRYGGWPVFLMIMALILLCLIFPQPASYLGDAVFWVFDRGVTPR